MPRYLVLFLAVCILFVSGCVSTELRKLNVKPARVKKKPRQIFMIITGYCDCKKCTGWRRNFLLKPVFARGRLRGKRKYVGITADGTKAIKGIIAADTDYYPYGTIFFIPGYGFGVVHDTGSKIKGKYRLDLFFSSHEKAMEWGNQKMLIKLWRDDRARPEDR